MGLLPNRSACFAHSARQQQNWLRLPLLGQITSMLGTCILHGSDYFPPQVSPFFELCYACQQGQIPFLRLMELVLHGSRRFFGRGHLFRLLIEFHQSVTYLRTLVRQVHVLSRDLLFVDTTEFIMFAAQMNRE